MRKLYIKLGTGSCLESLRDDGAVKAAAGQPWEHSVTFAVGERSPRWNSSLSTPHGRLHCELELLGQLSAAAGVDPPLHTPLCVCTHALSMLTSVLSSAAS